MIRKSILVLGLLALWLAGTRTEACSVLYYTDPGTGRIFIANNEDYQLDVDAVIRVNPRRGKQLARLWYGWDDFAQGGVNEEGLFFDGAVTPQQEIPDGYTNRLKGNFGDRLLAQCKTVDEALAFLEAEHVALTNAHMMFGDRHGRAVVVEWVDRERRIIPMTKNYLVMTNFLLSDTTKGNYPCYRYNAITHAVEALNEQDGPIGLREVGRCIAPAVVVPRQRPDGMTGGTLYSTFIELTGNDFVLVYKLDNANLVRLNLDEEFTRKKKRTIHLGD